MDITMSRAPDFGRLSPNVFYLQGFSGHGVALTVLAGKLVAEAISGQAERFDIFSKIQHHVFPGGKLLRMPALVLGMALSLIHICYGNCNGCFNFYKIATPKVMPAIKSAWCAWPNIAVIA